jgi:hypothetical protein
VPTNVGGQQIVHRDIPRKRCGYVASSPKFGSHKMLTNLPRELHFATGSPHLDGSVNLMARLVDLPRYFRAWRKRGLLSRPSSNIVGCGRNRVRNSLQSADRPERIPEGGTRTKMAYGGLFKEATLTRGRQMEQQNTRTRTLFPQPPTVTPRTATPVAVRAFRFGPNNGRWFSPAKACCNQVEMSLALQS